MDKPPARSFVKTALILLVLGLLAGGGYFAVAYVYPALHQGSQIAARLAADLEDALHFRPRVTVDRTTVFAESRTIQELALVQKAFDHTFDWKQTYLGSTKEIELKGSFVAKAGYDLAQPFSIDVSSDGKTIRATAPPAKVLSIEQTHFEVLKDDSGWWNTISAQDRQEAMNALLLDARQSLARTSLLRDTDKALSDVLEKQFRKESPRASVEIQSAH